MRRVARGLVLLLAVLALSIAVGVGMATTTVGFRWLGDAAVFLSGGRLAVEGLEGHVGVPVRIGKLVFTTAKQRITLERARLEWQPRALLRGRLAIDLLAAQTVRIDILKKDTAPPTLPGMPAQNSRPVNSCSVENPTTRASGTAGRSDYTVATAPARPRGPSRARPGPVRPAWRPVSSTSSSRATGC